MVARSRAIGRGCTRAAHLAAAALAAMAASFAGAATTSVVVSMDVPSATTLVTTGCAPSVPGITAFGTVQPGTSALTPQDCVVSFGSSNDSAALLLTQSDGLGTAMGRPTNSWVRRSGASARYFDVDGVGGTVWIAQSTGAVRRSLDGGATWGASQTGLGGNNFAISVPTATAAWLAGDGTDAVRRTTNGTAATPTWALTTAAPGFLVRGIDAASATAAWVVGDDGMLRSTADGGASWTTHAWIDQPGGPSSTEDEFQDVRSMDADSVAAFGPGGRVVATSDGSTWRDISIPGGYTINDVAILSDTTMVAVGNDGYAFRTTNATAATPTWSVVATGTARHLEAIDFLNATDGIAIGDLGTLLRTSDGGASWTVGHLGVAHPMQGAAVVGAGTIVTAGAGNNVMRSTDSGATWSSVVTGPQTWTGVSMTTDATGWRVGGDGEVERTTDGGATWSAQASGTGVDLLGVFAFTTQRAVAVGRAGTVIATSDGGATWNARPSGTTVQLESVSGVRNGTAWAVGAGGVVLRTTDHGTSWTQQHAAAGVLLHDVAATSGTSAVAVGRGGVTLRTTDGTSWTSSTLPIAFHAYSIASDPTGSAYLTQVSSTMFLSTDGGATWTSAGSSGVAFKDIAMGSTTRWIGVTEGRMRSTSDGGATWSSMTGSPTAHWSYSVDAFDPSAAVVVGDGGLGGTTTAVEDVADYVNGTSDWVGDGTEAFGACLRTTTATAAWTPSATCDQSADGAHWRGIPAGTATSGKVASTTSGQGTREARLRFGLRVAPDQSAGQLSAGLTFVVIAPDA